MSLFILFSICETYSTLSRKDELGKIVAREKLRRFMRAIEKCEDASEFIPEIWHGTVERGVVMAGGEVAWEMMDGERIRVKL